MRDRILQPRAACGFESAILAHRNKRASKVGNSGLLIRREIGLSISSAVQHQLEPRVFALPLRCRDLRLHLQGRRQSPHDFSKGDECTETWGSYHHDSVDMALSGIKTGYATVDPTS